jgi:hypothetical protein
VFFGNLGSVGVHRLRDGDESAWPKIVVDPLGKHSPTAASASQRKGQFVIQIHNQICSTLNLD